MVTEVSMDKAMDKRSSMDLERLVVAGRVVGQVGFEPTT
jgi:hypothetical protein